MPDTTTADLIERMRWALSSLETSDAPLADSNFNFTEKVRYDLPLLLDRLAALEVAHTADILVEGSWFKRSELPTILANHMRSNDQYGRQWKDAAVENATLRDLAAGHRLLIASGEKEIAELRERLVARMIDNPEDLDALPIGTVVINDGGQVAQRYDGMGGWWQVLDADQLDSADLIGTGWVTVLHIPAEVQDGAA